MTEAHSWVACMEKAIINAGFKKDVMDGGWPFEAMKIIYLGTTGR